MSLQFIGADELIEAFDRTAGRRKNDAIYADYVPIELEAWTTGIALVDVRIDLDQTIIGFGADVAVQRRNDASGNCAAETERIPDREDPIADARRFVGKSDERKIGATIDLDESEITFWITGNDFRLMGQALVRDDFYRLALIDDMVIGHRMTVVRNAETRAVRRQRPHSAAGKRDDPLV